MTDKEEGGRVRKAILDAFEADGNGEGSIGKPSGPVLPLVGSLNVDVNNEEEMGDE